MVTLASYRVIDGSPGRAHQGPHWTLYKAPLVPLAPVRGWAKPGDTCRIR